MADGNLNAIPVESVNYGGFPLCGIQLLLFIDDINKVETWDKYIGNVYLDAKTLKKIFIISGAEFGDREGHIFIFSETLYGLRYSGLLWHESFSDCLIYMGFLL